MSLKNKFKKERSPLTSLDEVRKYKAKFGKRGSGRKRRLPFDDNIMGLEKIQKRSTDLDSNVSVSKLFVYFTESSQIGLKTTFNLCTC